MGRAYIRARRSGRGRWCRFLHGIVPGRDAPGSEPTTPLGRDARGSRGCTLAVSYVRSDDACTRAFIEVLIPHTHTRAHRRRARSRPAMRRFDGRDVSRVTYGTTGAVPEDTMRSRSLRVYEHCSALRIRVVGQCRNRLTCPLRVS